MGDGGGEGVGGGGIGRLQCNRVILIHHSDMQRSMLTNLVLILSRILLIVICCVSRIHVFDGALNSVVPL